MSIGNEKENAVAAFFKDPSVAKAVTDMVVRKKPMGWSRRSNTAYFKEPYALALKEVIDEMLRTREDQIYFYKDFPNVSRTTLYQKINMSLRYLLEFLDTPDRLYARWNEMVVIKQEAGVGVAIRFIPALKDGIVADFKPKAVLPKAEVPSWKQKIDDYLEDARLTKPLHLDKLALTPDEMQQIKDSLSQLRGIVFVIRAYEIKIIKTNEH